VLFAVRDRHAAGPQDSVPQLQVGDGGHASAHHPPGARAVVDTVCTPSASPASTAA